MMNRNTSTCLLFKSHLKNIIVCLHMCVYVCTHAYYSLHMDVRVQFCGVGASISMWISGYQLQFSDLAVSSFTQRAI